MNPEHLDLIEEKLRASATLVRDTMLGGGIASSEANAGSFTVGRIHVEGDLAFTVELSMPDADAALIASALLGMAVSAEDPLVADAFGEFTNLVVGSAKSSLEGHACTLSVPEVGHASAAGKSLRILRPGGGLSPLQIDIHAPAAA